MEKNVNTEVKEQLRDLGGRMEEAISRGDEVIIGEPERVWLREMMIKKGVDFGCIKEKGDATKQANRVVQALGGNETLELTIKVVKEWTKLLGGSVLDKFEVPSLNFDQELERTIRANLEDEIFGDTQEDVGIKFSTVYRKGWDKKVIFREESALSAINRIMYILAAENEDEAKTRQSSESVLHRLRERVLRGKERTGTVIESNVKRYGTSEYRKKIKHVPVGGLVVIMSALVEI